MCLLLHGLGEGKWRRKRGQEVAPGLQGLFRAPVVSDLELRREVQHLRSHFPMAAGMLAQLKRPPTMPPFPPRSLGFYFSTPKCVPVSHEPQITFSGPQATVEIPIWPS